MEHDIESPTFEEIGSPVVIEDYVVIGTRVTILPGVTIGKGAVTAAAAVVTKDVPDFALVYGNPAKLAGWICGCGEKLNLRKRRAVCRSCGKRYSKNGFSVKREGKNAIRQKISLYGVCQTPFHILSNRAFQA